MNASGRMRAGLAVTAGSLAIIAVLSGLLYWQSARQRPARAREPLVVYCAAGIKQPVEAVAREYEKLYGEPVQLQYGGSGTLLANLRVAQSGDLYLAADESYLAPARAQGLIAETIPLAKQHPVIAVHTGNPKKITSLDDLVREDVRVSFASPDAASIGKVSKRLLEGAGRWARIEEHIRDTGVYKPTVNDVANDVKIGSVDAGVVWDSTARQYPELEIVEAPLFQEAVQQITINVLTFSKQPTAALRFARYLGARDKGLLAFKRYHYEPVEGDAWSVAPDVVLYSGAMLRPGVAKTLEEFEKREGVRITTVYNGCGILTAQMRAGDRPDAYFSCDEAFMATVADLYQPRETVTDNDLMIVVKKGNPLGIHSVRDLARSDVRVGLPHHEKSAMGNIAWKMLQAMGVYDAVAANMKVESPTGDFLVNQLRTGSLDAIIACRSNVSAVTNWLEGIAIDHPMARLSQPYAVGRSTNYPNLLSRLQRAITSAESRQRFLDAGFGWHNAPPANP